MEFRKEMMLKEIEKKGGANQLSWFRKNFKRIYLDSGLLPDEIPKKAFLLNEELKKWEERMKIRSEAEIRRFKEERLKPTERKWRPTIVTKWDLERGIMYPVEPEVTAVLYEGISHNDEGRRRYLYLRNLDAPYDRFYESQSGGMDYGWQIEERAFPANKQFAMNEVIKSEFYRRNGMEGETWQNRHPLSKGLSSPEQL